MHKPSESPPNTPKAIKRRYQRRTARWWTVAGIFGFCAFWSAAALDQLYHPRRFQIGIDSPQDRRTILLAGLPIDFLRLMGFADHTITIMLTCSLVISAVPSAVLVILLFGFAPRGYWVGGKKVRDSDK